MQSQKSQRLFSNLRVRGFRRLHDVDFPLRPLSVLIGANSTGKTSVLDVLSLLASSASGKMSTSISELGGLTSILTYDRSKELELEIAMGVAGHQPLDYSLRVRPDGISYRIENESLSQKRKADPPPFFHLKAQGPDVQLFQSSTGMLTRLIEDHDPRETSLSQVSKNPMNPESQDFGRRLASSTFYRLLDVSARSPVRLPQQMQLSPLPGKNGEELVSCLYYLRETEHHRFEAIEDAMRAAFSRFERLEIPPVAAGTIALAWREKGFSRPLYMHQLSEGTVRFLWLATLLQSPDLTDLTLLDEPEVSLHPELHSLLADLLREASLRTQIVVATHSDRLVRFLTPSEILTMNTADNGTTELRWADQLNLENWLNEYTLDELWSNGRLGARA